MKKFSFAVIAVLVFSLSSGVFAYTATTQDEAILNSVYKKIDELVENNSTKAEKVKSKLEVALKSFDTETRIWFILNELYVYMVANMAVSVDDANDEKIDRESDEEKTVLVREEDEKTEVENGKYIVDSVEYEIEWLYFFDEVGTENTFSEMKQPENWYRLIVEFTYKNIHESEDKYPGTFLVVDWENQYEESSTAKVYGEYQMWYESYTYDLKPWTKKTTYVWFDVKNKDLKDWYLTIDSFSFSDDDLKIQLEDIWTIKKK